MLHTAHLPLKFRNVLEELSVMHQNSRMWWEVRATLNVLLATGKALDGDALAAKIIQPSL